MRRKHTHSHTHAHTHTLTHTHTHTRTHTHAHTHTLPCYGCAYVEDSKTLRITDICVPFQNEDTKK